MDRLIFQKELADEAATAALAARIAPILKAGDTLLLQGQIGAGKSVFARAVIRARLGQNEDVPSPTFTIVQTYPDTDVDIWHCDLYRLSHPDNAIELGLLDAMETDICLIEWPEVLGDDAPKDGLWLTFVAGHDAHSLTARGSAAWAQRVEALHV